MLPFGSRGRRCCLGELEVEGGPALAVGERQPHPRIAHTGLDGQPERPLISPLQKAKQRDHLGPGEHHRHHVSRVWLWRQAAEMDGQRQPALRADVPVDDAVVVFVGIGRQPGFGGGG